MRRVLVGAGVALAALAFSVPTHAVERRAVTGCAGQPGFVELLSPRPGQVISTGVLRVRIRARCREGLPVNIGIDGVGYDLRRTRLIPAPNYNPGCPAYCWPQFGAAPMRGTGRLRATARIRPGRHLLVLKPGIQGSGLSSFRRIEVRFRVKAAGAELAERVL